MSYIFGPVPSRRLGFSLGIDLVPYKTCTFDCLYCEVGRTTNKTITGHVYVPVHELLNELKERLSECSPEVITLAGSGEPTLHAEIDHIIGGIGELTDIPVVVLTNGSLFWNEAVRRRVMGAHVIMPTLSSFDSGTFRTIHNPHEYLDLERIIEGLLRLRQEFRGLLYLEIVLLAGINDTEAEMSKLRPVIDRIGPDKIQLNTVARPPAHPSAKALDRERLEAIKLLLGERAEIVLDTGPLKDAILRHKESEALLETLKRRPLRIKDMADATGLPSDQVERVVKGLLLKGYLRRQDHQGDIFYMGSDPVEG